MQNPKQQISQRTRRQRNVATNCKGFVVAHGIGGCLHSNMLLRRWQAIQTTPARIATGPWTPVTMHVAWMHDRQYVARYLCHPDCNVIILALFNFAMSNSQNLAAHGNGSTSGQLDQMQSVIETGNEGCHSFWQTLKFVALRVLRSRYNARSQGLAKS